MKRTQFLIVVFLATILALSGCTLSRKQEPPLAQDEPPAQQPPAGQPSADQPASSGELDSNNQAMGTAGAESLVPGQVLVKFKPEVVPQLPTEKRQAPQGLSLGSQQLDPSLKAMGITGLEPVLKSTATALNMDFAALSAQADGLGRLYVAEFDTGQNPDEVAKNLTANEAIEYAEPNFIAEATDGPHFAPPALTPNDPFFSYQWNLQAIQMPQAWDKSTGQNVIVAVLDTGVAYENFEGFEQAPDLVGTHFVAGYDFVNDDAHPNDDQGHGTHVAGTLAQATNNNQGVAGVAFGARLMPVKVLNQRGQGSYQEIIQGINFAVNNGAKVINLSLAGPASSQALEEALQQARNRGVTVVAASGNTNGPIGYPATSSQTLAVGAITFDLQRARYSNFGSQLDLVAPGGDNRTDNNQDGFGDGIVQQSFKAGQINQFKYLFFEGTSMATPHVSGVIALLLASKPDLTPDQIKGLLLQTAKDLGSPGRDDQFGYGLIQADNALVALTGGTPPTPTPTPTTPPPGDGATPTPTATVAPLPAGNILQNSGFEADQSWLFNRTVWQGSYSTAVKRSGNRSALIGIVNPQDDVYSFSSVAQKVAVPADATQVVLRAYIYPVTQNPGSTDRQIISVLNHNFVEVKRLYNGLSNDQAWQEKTFDLTAYRGQTIYVYFGVINRADDDRPSAMYVDDVTLDIAK